MPEVRAVVDHRAVDVVVAAPRPDDDWIGLDRLLVGVDVHRDVDRVAARQGLVAEEIGVLRLLVVARVLDVCVVIDRRRTAHHLGDPLLLVAGVGQVDLLARDLDDGLDDHRLRRRRRRGVAMGAAARQTDEGDDGGEGPGEEAAGSGHTSKTPHPVHSSRCLGRLTCFHMSRREPRKRRFGLHMF
jgi:hypothetical protein